MAKRKKTTTKKSARGRSSTTKRGAAGKSTPKGAAKKKSKKKVLKKAAPRKTGKGESEADSKALSGLRTKIDRLDGKLVAMLNERAGLVVSVGKIKRGSDVPIYAPHREAQVLERVLGSNEGPLPGRTIEGVYRELMSGSFALEQPLRIGYLGPAGSYSHQASVKHFGSSVEYEDLHTIGGVFTEVRRGHVNYGLVPIENSIGGGIVEALDAFQHHAEHVFVYAEVQINVHHALLSNAKPKQLQRIHSKPEVFDQCRNWLATQYPMADLMPAASTSRAVQTALEENRKADEIGARPASAAIASSLAGEIYGLPLLFARIEDNPNNITRFYIIANEEAKRSGDDKTSMMFTTANKSGALVDVLSVFQTAGINLSHIDKRPSGRENWQYTFYIDALGYREDKDMKAAIAEARSHCKDLHVLGSYPRSKRIL